jgi:hypothetical protein
MPVTAEMCTLPKTTAALLREQQRRIDEKLANKDFFRLRDPQARA